MQLVQFTWRITGLPRTPLDTSWTVALSFTQALSDLNLGKTVVR